MSALDDDDPPRLRALTHELPAELSAALETMPSEEATAEELRAVAAGVHRVLAAEPPKPAPQRSRSRGAASRRVLSLALTFAVGAGAGVVVTVGVFMASRPPHLEPASSTPLPSAAPTVPRERAAPPASTPPPATPARAETSAPSVRPGSMPSGSARNAVDDDEKSDSLPSQDELALVARAQAALARTPGAALSIVGEHERRFPEGALVQEREVIAIDALLRLGRQADAEARATRFHQRFPTSAHGRRVDVLLEVRK
jgi:hypothetical protein